MKKVNVLQLIDALNVGGAEVLALNTHNAFQNDDHITSFLVTTRGKGDLEDSIENKSNFQFIKKNNVLDPFFYAKIIRFIKKNKISVIHAHTTSYFSAAIIKILLYGKIKLIWHNHTGANIQLKGFKYRVTKRLSRFFNVIIHVNHDLQIWGETNLQAKENIVLLNFPMFIDKSKQTQLKGVEGKRIGIVGGLREVKDHLTLFQAFQSILKSFPDWSLHVIGKDYEDEYSHKVRSFVNQDSQLKDSVYFYGLRTDVEFVLSQLNIAVLSSKSEGLPLSLLEYGLGKLPVIVTDVGQCREVVQDFGIIVEKENPEQLANAIEKFIEDEQYREKMANSFYDHVNQHYALKSYYKKLSKIYSE